ncbi:MAG: hypothetical protein LBR73_02470 [Oscillospiraceae bacterium]|jgi:hypothetical protein|nr:hypothetical protein [Oscillospiraceae bacterium]
MEVFLALVREFFIDYGWITIVFELLAMSPFWIPLLVFSLQKDPTLKNRMHTLRNALIVTAGNVPLSFGANAILYFRETGMNFHTLLFYSITDTFVFAGITALLLESAVLLKYRKITRSAHAQKPI